MIQEMSEMKISLEILILKIHFHHDISYFSKFIFHNLFFKFEVEKIIAIMKLNEYILFVIHFKCKAGKSTLFNLLSFVEESISGLLILDNCCMKKYYLTEFRKNIAILFQNKCDSFLAKFFI